MLFMKKVGIIGSGIGGLASAVRMARLGYRVEVFEQSDRVGGKLNEFRQDGFRFDTGPSLFTLPWLVDELLDEDLRFAYRKLEVVTRYFYEDGTQLSAFADAGRFAYEVETKTSVPGNRLMRYLRHAALVYDLTAPIFIFNSIHRLGRLFTWTNMGRALQFFRLKAFTSLHRFNQHVFGDERVVQLFDRFATYNGSDPFKAPGTLSVISHLEHNLGAYFPEEGMYRIAVALEEQARRLGCVFHFNTPVERILTDKDGVCGLQAGGLPRSFDVVISDVDIHHLYRSLLPDAKRLRRIERADRSSSALIFYWGMKSGFPQLDVHNIFFSKDYRHEFLCLFEEKTIADDPTVYVFISSKVNPADAPPGMENWFVMVNAPENVGQDWTVLRQKTRKQILQKLERLLHDDLEPKILFEKVLDPVLIERRTSSFQGAMYGPSSNSRLAAFNRHANFRSDIAGLYFVGGSVHPGGGIPLCLSSAKIVAGMVEDE